MKTMFFAGALAIMSFSVVFYIPVHSALGLFSLNMIFFAGVLVGTEITWKKY